MPDITIYLPGETGGGDFAVVLRNHSTRAVLNGAGDIFSEDGSTGWFEGTVAETIAAVHDAILSRGGIDVIQGHILAGETEIRLGPYDERAEAAKTAAESAATEVGKVPRAAAAVAAGASVEIENDSESPTETAHWKITGPSS